MFLERTGRAQDPGVGARGLKTYWGLAYWREGQRHTMTHQPATPDPAHRTLHTSPPCADGTLHPFRPGHLTVMAPLVQPCLRTGRFLARHSGMPLRNQ